MPHFRKTFRRRRFRPRHRRRTRFRRRRTGNRMVRKVNIALARSKPERKFVDVPLYSIQGSLVGTTVDAMNTTSILQGVDTFERIGNRLFMRNYDVRFSIQRSATATAVTQVTRVIWFKYFENDTPSAGTILETPSMFSHYRKSGAGLWKILSDRFYTIGSQGNAVLNIYRRSIVQLKDKWIYTSGTDTLPNSKRVFIVIIGEEAVSTLAPVLFISLRANYYDS